MIQRYLLRLRLYNSATAMQYVDSSGLGYVVLVPSESNFVSRSLTECIRRFLA